MSFYWVKTNAIIRKLFSNYIWLLPNNEKKIYLTFDDGPIPEVTEWVLAELKKNNAKASFFCIGKNIEANPDIFKKIINDGHSIGNHTYNHLNGWKTSTENYLADIEKCENAIIKSACDFKRSTPQLFRPPYGKIKTGQTKRIKSLGYKIIMWDVLSGDFDQKIAKEKCLDNLIQNIEPGSIIVFHDSVKASKNLKYALPKVLDYLNNNNFSYARITEESFTNSKL